MSIYATIPGLGDPDGGDDPAPGLPWVYQGSHILPSEDDPRGGHVGLALIPSHITRDDAPEDGTPWPWLRLDIHTGTDDPTLLLNPAQARHLAAQLTDWADQADPDAHHYLSTGCRHGEHAYCQGKTGQAGTKKPGVCKFCDAPCVCDCHATTKETRP